MAVRASDKTTSLLVYDNMLGAADTTTASTPVAGGSIVIHAVNGPVIMASRSGPDDGGGKSPSAALPVEYGLSQNHPNPVDQSTLIDFSLPERSEISLVVYDVLGREVRTLADGEREPGRYSATLTRAGSNGSTLGAGIYFVRMSAQSLASGRNFNSLRKIVLLK